MLGFGRAAVPRRATLQTSDQIVVQVAHMQVARHRAVHEAIDLNDLTWHPAGQDAPRRGKIWRFCRNCFRGNRRIGRVGGFQGVGCSGLGVYLSSEFRLLALTARANSIRRRIASDRDGLSCWCLAQFSMADLSAGGSRTVSTGSRPVAGRPGFFGITFSFDRHAMFW